MRKLARQGRRTIKTIVAGQLAVAASAALIAIASAEEAKPVQSEATKPNSATESKEAIKKVERPHIDLAFCIDTTGSMQGEIDEVKSKTKEIVAKLSSGKPSPVIRVGLVAFRDRGDQYVTKVFPFTDDIDKVVKDISALQAAGGGDAPEAVAHALHSSVHELQWDGNNKTLKLLFVIGDAGPNKADTYDWRGESKAAIAKGIQINTIGCDGLDRFDPAAGSQVFQEIARLADGKFEFLSYKSEVAQADGTSTTIVHNAGRAYKLKSGEGGAWRRGAKDLAAAGIASEVDAPAALDEASTRPRSRAMMLSRKSMSGAAMPMGYMSSRAAGGGGGSAADSESGSYSSFSRRENNLADMVLGATKKAAENKIQVKFDTK